MHFKFDLKIYLCELKLTLFLFQSFALFEEAPLSRYTITVKVDDAREVEANFEVAEYTLPRFEISLKDPSAVVPG